MATRRDEPEDDDVGGEGPPYIHEWLRHGTKKNWPDMEVGKELGVGREAVFKWRKHPEKVKALRQAQIALLLGIQAPLLWTKPGGREHKMWKLVVNASELDD